ncbi:hypothetical protein JGU66_06290 [Myxococcaceae bacterium JPH2]|nr:hypothetical protein [Myxococcaceae bacterium JPH2]
MSYSQSLEVLARLHVDPRFRRAWGQDASAALSGYALTPREREALLRADAVVVDRAGRMMDYHRGARVTEQLPWVDASKRPELGPRLQRFMTEALPELLNREEAITFCRDLEARPEGLPAYVSELARCERLRLGLAWGLEPMTKGARVESFTYPVLEILAALARPGWPEVAPRPTRVEYLKVPGLPAVLVRG